MIPPATVALELIGRSTLLLTMVLLATWLLRRSTPVLAATAQNGFLVGLLLLPGLTLLGPSLPWIVLPARRGDAIHEIPVRTPESPRLAETHSRDREPAVERPVSIPASSLLAADTPLVTPTAPAPRPQAAPILASEKAASGRFRLPAVTVGGIVATFYAAGFLLLLTRIVLGLWRLRGLINEASPVRHGTWTDELNWGRAVLNLKHTVCLVASNAVSTPLTFAWRNPVIVIPAELERMATPEQRRAAILHELTHVRRSDFAWHLLLRFVEAIYWFHPLQWLVSRSIAATRERVCDGVCGRHLGMESYANSLIELAGRRSRLRMPAVGLAMARSSKLGSRLDALQRYGPSEQSLPFPRQLAAIAVPVALLVLGSASLKPVAADAPPSTGTVTVSGWLIAVGGEPFGEQELQLKVVSWIPRSGSGEKTIERALKTDRDGRFAFELVLEPQPQAHYKVKVSGIAFMPHALSLTGEDLRNGTLGNLESLPRFAKTARVLDPNGQPVAGAHVEAVAKREDGNDKNETPPLREEVETDGAGHFTVHVPRKLDFGLIVRSNRGAIARLVVPAGAEPPTNIQLERGATISGRVLDRAGKPVRGCVVSVQADDDQTIRTELQLDDWGRDLLGIEIYRVTDGEGRFHFPPLLGDFVVTLMKRGEVFSTGSPEYKSAIDPPPIVPVSIHVDTPGEKLLTLIEAPTATIRGTVRWQDGRPAAGVRSRAGAVARGWVRVPRSRSDKDRQGWPLFVPRALAAREAEAHDPAAAWFRWPGLGDLASRSQSVALLAGFHALLIGRVDGDCDGLDWVIVPPDKPLDGGIAKDDDPREEAPGPAPGADLLALEREITAADKAWKDVYDSARTEPEKDRAHPLDPRVVMGGRCLEFEARHRGTRAGLGALYFVTSAAATTSGRQIEAALDRAIAVLQEHYVAHADVDMLISGFTNGSPPIEAESLLRKVAAESPHDYVRAAALYELAAVLIQRAWLLQSYREHGEEMDRNAALMLSGQRSERARESIRFAQDHAKRFLAASAGRDLDALGTEAQRLLDQIVTQFSGVRAPHRRWNGPAKMRSRIQLVDAPEDPEFRHWSVPERAPSVCSFR